MGRTESSASGYAPLDETDEYDPSVEDFIAKERNYIHFDLPLSFEEREKEPTPDEISKNSFWPLLGFDIVERQLKHDKSGKAALKKKSRPIKFGSHKDAAIFQWYAHRLLQRYEDHLRSSTYSPSVLAYRKGVGDNVTQARDLIIEIRERGCCKAVAMDIEKFFDTIDHSVLLSALKRVLKTERLEQHDFVIFERSTKFEWVDGEAAKKRLGKKYGRGGRICTSEEFKLFIRTKVESLVQRNPFPRGIPQGTPLSGLYANIAMIEFDRVMSAYMEKRKGSYRRYSDDLAFVMPHDADEELVIRHAKRQLKRFGLSANENKTDIAVFSNLGGKQSANKPFQYLGFLYDGEHTLIRPSSINRFYRKMAKGVRAKVQAAKQKNVPPNQIYMRELFRRYTHFGKSRRNHAGQKIGNFPRYAYRASEVLDAPEIRQQMKNHMRIFKRAVRNQIHRIYGPITLSKVTK